MKKRMTIGEFARLKNITAETLQHYDRIGLLKPVEVDEETGYRYYTMEQFEDLSTIMELRRLGFSLPEIKELREMSDPGVSLQVLRQREAEVTKEIEALEDIRDSIRLDRYQHENCERKILFREIPTRHIVEWKVNLYERLEYPVGCALLERSSRRAAPFFAECRYGVRYIKGGEEPDGRLFLFLDEPDMGISGPETEIREIPGGFYATMLLRSEIEELDPSLEKMEERVRQMGYRIAGDEVLAIHVDLPATGENHQLMGEFQIPVEKI